ncbi:MAG: diguanylate cyclase, partial [Chloroflexi bacterium]|nr:diguanylate cyclase [Chloroflexota bacterium]
MSDSSSFIASTGDESSSRHSLKSAGKPASGAVRADPQQVHSGEAEDEGRATPKVTHILAFPLRFVSSLSIRVTLALGFSLAAIVLVGLVGLYIFEQGRAAAQEELHGKLAAVAASVAVSVDAEAHQRIQALPDESSPDYVQLKSYLQAIRAANPDIRHVYTMVPSSDPNIWRFVVDAESNPETMSHVGEYDVSRSPEIPAALHGPVADQAITTDKWGQWLSGYAPIRNRDGQAIGIVGVDMSAETVTAKETGLRNSLIFSLLAAAAVAAALGTLLAHYFARPIRALAKVTERVAQGDLQVSAETRRRDELGDLAHRFNHMVQRLRESQESLLELANTDALTDLVNHRHGQELLARELVRALRSKHPLGVVMLDVDNFKLFNDSYGHLHGDQVLKSVAALLTRATRSTDIVARYGGDEFILVLPETDSSGVDKTIKRISAEMASLSYSDADKE